MFSFDKSCEVGYSFINEDGKPQNLSAKIHIASKWQNENFKITVSKAQTLLMNPYSYHEIIP